MSEIWLPVVDYEGLYSVSDHGRVRSEPRIIAGHHGSTRRWAGGILKTNSGRYPAVALWRGNSFIKRRVHELVMETFVGPRPDGLEVLHRDDNPKNNVLSNIRYDTHAENMADVARNRFSCKHGHAFTLENTYIRRDTGTRQCKQCCRNREIARKAS